jgi:hypothetical protein
VDSDGNENEEDDAPRKGVLGEAKTRAGGAGDNSKEREHVGDDEEKEEETVKEEEDAGEEADAPVAPRRRPSAKKKRKEPSFQIDIPPLKIKRRLSTASTTSSPSLPSVTSKALLNSNPYYHLPSGTVMPFGKRSEQRPSIPSNVHHSSGLSSTVAGATSSTSGGAIDDGSDSKDGEGEGGEDASDMESSDMGGFDGADEDTECYGKDEMSVGFPCPPLSFLSFLPHLPHFFLFLPGSAY